MDTAKKISKKAKKISKKLMDRFPLTTMALLMVLAMAAITLTDKIIHTAIQRAAERAANAILHPVQE